MNVTCNVTYYYGCYKNSNTTIIREKLLKSLYPRYPSPRNDSPFSFCQGKKIPYVTKITSGKF